MADRTSLLLARTRREAQPCAPSSTGKTLLERLQPVLPLVQALLVLGLSYWLIQRVELTFKQGESALRESQHAIQSTQSLQLLLRNLHSAETLQASERIVIQLAMHGEAALYPLFVLAVTKNPYPAESVIPGLRLLAVRHPARVCELLVAGLKLPGAVNELRRGAVEELKEQVCAVQAAGSPP